MTRYTCQREDCGNEYTTDAETDSLFVSYSISPHDVEEIEPRAFSVCEECAREIEASIEAVLEGDVRPEQIDGGDR